MIEVYMCILLFGAVIYVVGHSLIKSFFDRKEEIINRMTEKG